MGDKRTELYFDTLEEPVKPYIEELEQKAIKNEVPIIRRATRNLLRYLLKTKQPHNVLEIGTAVGYSALFMKECMAAEARITTIEKVPARIQEARKNLECYDKEQRITLLEGDAADWLKCLVKKGETFDFIFMDAAKGQYMNFIPDVLALLREGGTLVSDNILHDGDVIESRYAVNRRDRTIHSRMRHYLDFLMHHDKLETICLSLGDGVTVSTKIRR